VRGEPVGNSSGSVVVYDGVCDESDEWLNCSDGGREFGLMLFVADGVGVGDGHDSTRHDTDELRGNGVNGGDRGGGGGGGEFRTLSIQKNKCALLKTQKRVTIDG